MRGGRFSNQPSAGPGSGRSGLRDEGLHPAGGEVHRRHLVFMNQVFCCAGMGWVVQGRLRSPLRLGAGQNLAKLGKIVTGKVLQHILWC